MSPAMTRHADAVRSFYAEIWERGELSRIPALLHEGFTFRGSLGSVLTGHAAFADYVRRVTGALAEYRCEILDLIEEGPRLAARMRFGGTHRGPLFGIPATGRAVAWDGAAFFTFEGDRVRDLWVLGDVHGLLGQLRA